MKVILDRLDHIFYQRGLECVYEYVNKYMFDGRNHGPRNCVVFSYPSYVIWVYHTKSNNVVVRGFEQ